MIFILLLALLIITIYVSHRQLGLAMILALAFNQISQLIKFDLAKFIISLGLKLSLNKTAALISLILVLLSVLIIIYRSHKRSRKLITIILESILLMSLLIIFIGQDLIQLIKIDQLSIQISQFLLPYTKFIVIMAGFYGFWSLIVKDQE